MSWQDDPVVGAPKVTEELMDKLRTQESRGNPNATSPKGAVGPYQLMPATYKDAGLDETSARDETSSRRVAKGYLQKQVDRFGTLEKGLAAYNWGPENVAKQGMDKMPKETRDYVKALAGGGGEKKAEAKGWEQDPIVGDDKVSPMVMGMKPGGIVAKTAAVVGEAALNTAVLADMVLSLPGMTFGVAGDMGRRLYGVMSGENRKVTEQEAAKMREQFSEPFSNPIEKLMHLSGYKEGYSQSQINQVMSGAMSWLDKGGEWVEKNTHGVFSKADVGSLVNEAMALGGIRGTSALITKGVEKLGKPKAAAEKPTLRETEEATVRTEAKPQANEAPETVAKRNIEAATGITDVKARDALRKQQQADVRAAFAEDPKYADYLDKYAAEEVRQRDVAAAAADQMERGTTLDTKLMDKAPPQEVSWGDALTVLKKPGFRRTPEDIVKLRQFNKQSGKVDADTLIRLAAVGIGVAAGINLDPDHPVEGALLGLAGAAIVTIAPKQAVAKIREVWKTDTRIRATELFNDHEVAIARSVRSVWQATQGIASLVPSADRRAAVTKWMQGDKSVPLTNKEYQAATQARTFFDEAGKAGVSADVLHNLLTDYVTNLWDLNGAGKAVWEKLTSGPGMSPKSRFDLERKISSLEEGKKLGLVPVTEDVAQIMGIYGNSLYKTIANKKLLDTLKNTLVSGTADALVTAAKDAPKGYVPVSHPQLQGMLVHPDIVGAMRFSFQQSTPKGIMAGIEGINTAVKRSAIAFSIFHAKALFDAAVGAGMNPLKIWGIARGTDQYLKQIRNGGAGDLVDRALDGGMKFSYEKGVLAVDDANGNFYSAMTTLADHSSKLVPGMGVPIKGVIALNHAVDTLMWTRLHAGMKLNVFASTVEKLTKNNFEANAKDPNVRLKTKSEINEIAASYTNDLFGGLNWRRVAEEARTKWGRDLKMEVMSPTGRRVMQLAMFAPDWTISTTRAALKAFTGKGSGIKGLWKPQEIADLHRQYFIRSALYYATVGDALNYAMSGHHFWENKDPTILELGDGRTMQFSKHMMEPVHWATKPMQQALNKLGFIPSEMIEQATGKNYLSASGHAPPMDTSVAGRLRHLGKRFLPIAAGQLEASPEAAVAGALGFPIYGMTPEQRAEAVQKRKIKRELEAIKRRSE